MCYIVLSIASVNFTNFPIHLYADDSILHFSTFINIKFNLQLFLSTDYVEVWL